MTSAGDAVARTTERDVSVAYDVVDALGGAASLVRRSPTLDGSVPLRVAQACAPFLEGNAFGHQIALRDRFEAERSFGRWSFHPSDAAIALGHRARAILPALARRDLIDEVARARLARCWPADPTPRRTLALWTGLLVRPRAGVRLRVSSTANRRPRSFAVAEVSIDDGEAFTPLVLELLPRGPRLSLGGEIATVGALPRGTPRFVHTTLAAAPDLVSAHARFYDGDYFATKREGEVARRYRSLVRDAPRSPARGANGGEPPEGEEVVRVAEAGSSTLAPGGPVPGAPDRLVFRNAVPLAARFDGQRVEVTTEARARARFAASTRAAWATVEPLLGDALHQGAVLYFSKYVTPHPAGEAHFFVKPAALIGTPPGTSLLLEGAHGAGWDVLRGVVATDRFHATPAVFQLWSTDETITIAEGAPLVAMFPVPRALIDATFEASAVDLDA